MPERENQRAIEREAHKNELQVTLEEQLARAGIIEKTVAATPTQGSHCHKETTLPRCLN